MAPNGGLGIVANAADFIDEATSNGPDWEHLVFLRRPGTRKIAVDSLRTPPDDFMPGRRLLDGGLVRRLGRALRPLGRVLAQNETAGYLAALALVASLQRKPLAIIFHGHRWWTRRNRLMAGFVRRLPWVRFLCLSEALRRLVIEEYGVPPGRVHATGYGADARYFAGAPCPADGWVASAGTASRDYACLAAAGAGLAVRIRVAADSTWYREALNLDGDAVPDNMELFRAGGYDGLRALYAGARFVVVPLQDVRYACGYAVIAEAMAMGRAVIATRTGCPSDLIEDGVTGLYVPPGDAGALRAAMQRLLDDPALAARMGIAARRSVEARLGLDAYVARLDRAMAEDGAAPESPTTNAGRIPI